MPRISSTLSLTLEDRTIDATVMTRAQRLVNPTLESMSKSFTSFEESPDFVQLNKVCNSIIQDVIYEPPLQKPSTKTIPLV